MGIFVRDADGGIRTLTDWFLRPAPLPLGYVGLKKGVNPAGLEPAACRFGGDRSDPLNYGFKRAKLREKDSNLHLLGQSQTSCRLDDPERNDERGTMK